MNYFEYSYSFVEDPEVFLSLWSGFMSLGGLAGLACYIFAALGLYTIAKRRGLNHPGLCWIPLGFEWQLGSLSDQYQYLVMDKNTSRRKIMLGLSVLNWISGAVCTVVSSVMMVKLTFSVPSMTEGEIASAIFGPLMIVMGVALVLSVAAIVLVVFRYICMYDVYRSCEPGNATLYLVLSIIFNILEPVFLMVIRKKDGGMPPRKESPVQEPVPEAEVEPWEVSE